MSLETIYFVAGIVTGLGVIVSLLFVGLQMRQANVLARSEMTSATLDRFTPFWFQLSSDPELARAFQSLIFDGAKVEEPQASQLIYWFAPYINVVRAAYEDHKKGLMDEWALEMVEAQFVLMLRNPFFRSVYEDVSRRSGRSFMGEDAKEWITRIDRQIDALRDDLSRDAEKTEAREGLEG
ncbi:MAG: hypothetical protein RJS97_23050 [Parvibaculaceae bacterium]